MKAKLVEIDGKVFNGPELARIMGVAWGTVYARLEAGWAPVQAFGKPVGKRRVSEDLGKRMEWHRQQAQRHLAAANLLIARIERRNAVVDAQQGLEQPEV